MQKIMTCTTEKPSMRAAIVGWSFEDGNKVMETYCNAIGTKDVYKNINEIPVGCINSGILEQCSYPTILHALGDSWKLLVPPERYKEKHYSKGIIDMYEWWLVKS